MDSLFAMNMTRTTFRSIIYALLVLVQLVRAGDSPIKKPENTKSEEKALKDRDAGLQDIWKELAGYNGKAESVEKFLLDVRADTPDM